MDIFGTKAVRKEQPVEQAPMIILFDTPMLPSEREALQRKVGKAIASALGTLPYDAGKADVPDWADDVEDLEDAVYCQVFAIAAEQHEAKAAATRARRLKQSNDRRVREGKLPLDEEGNEIQPEAPEAPGDE